MNTSARLVAVATVSSLIAAGCREPLDTTREPVDTGTFGETIVTLVCKRIAYLDDLGDGGTTDVAGNTYRDACRLGLAAPADAPDALKALLAKYDDLSGAVDTMFPADFLPTLQEFLTSNEFLATYDEGEAVAAIDALIGVLRLLADDDEAMAALERLNVKIGYRPLQPALGAIRAAVRYPELHELLLALSTAVTPGGSARGEWDKLIAALGVTLRNAQPSATPDDPERTAALAVDLLLTEQPLLGTSKTIPLVRRDGRGVAEPASVGTLFVDGNSDGAADTNEVGQFVDAAGALLAVPQPFQLPEGADELPWPDRDDQGRPLDAAGGQLLYRYVDVDNTVLSAVSRDGVQLFDPGNGTALDLLRGASALLGPRVEATRTYDNGETLTYRGFDLDQSALLDMLFGFLQVMRDPAIYDVLDLARVLLVDKSAEVSRLAEAIIGAGRLGDAHPEAEIPADAPLWDDLIPVIQQVIARPALATGLMRALEQPQVKELGERFGKYLTYKDRFDINPSTHAVTGSFQTEVDHAVADSGYSRSLFQRLLHLINDSNGARLCNKQDARVVDPYIGITLGTYDECELVDIPNLAVFYIQSIAYARTAGGLYICENAAGAFDGTTTATTPQGCVAQGGGRRPRPKADQSFNWGGFVEGSIDAFGGDEFLEDTVGIAGFRTHPTPHALNRVLFLDPMPDYLTNVIDEVRDRDNQTYKSQHAGTLPVWELEGFYDQIRPVLQVFADNNAEQLFVDFMSALHKHWPTEDSISHQSVDPSAPDYVWGSGGNSYEPLMADILADRKLLDALVDVAPALDAVTVNGKSYPTIARNAASFLLTPLGGLTDRRGNLTSTTVDGRPVAVLSPWQVLADAYVMKQGRMDVAGPEGEAWTDSIAEVIDVLARGQEVPTVGWQFRSPRFRGVAVALLDFLESRLQHHDEVGDRTAWLTTEMPQDLENALSGPVLAGAADFVLSLQADPDTRVQLESMMRYLVDEVELDETYRTSVTAVADLLQLAVSDADIAPLARVAGEALRADRGWLEAQLIFVRKARESDVNRALVTMLINMYAETRPGRTAVGDLIDGISEVHRAAPYNDLGKRYTADDFRSLMSGLADTLDEEKRGLRKFIAIIQDRNQ